MLNGFLTLKAFGVSGLTGTGTTSGRAATLPSNIVVTDSDRWGLMVHTGPNNTPTAWTLNQSGVFYLAAHNGNNITSSTQFYFTLTIPL